MWVIRNLFRGAAAPAPAAPARGPPAGPPARTLAEGASFQRQKLTPETYNTLRANNEVTTVDMPIAEDTQVLVHRNRLIRDISLLDDCDRAITIVGEIEAGPKTSQQILDALGYNDLETEKFKNPIRAMQEAGILVYDTQTQTHMLTQYYWFNEEHPTTNDPQGRLRAPVSGHFQWIKMDSPRYKVLKDTGDVRKSAVMPIPHNGYVRAHRARLVRKITKKSSKFYRTPEIVEFLESGPKTTEDIKNHLGYKKAGTYYVQNPLQELQRTGIIVQIRPGLNKLAPFYWCS